MGTPIHYVEPITTQNALELIKKNFFFKLNTSKDFAERFRLDPLEHQHTMQK